MDSYSYELSTRRSTISTVDTWSAEEGGLRSNYKSYVISTNTETTSTISLHTSRPKDGALSAPSYESMVTSSSTIPSTIATHSSRSEDGALSGKMSITTTSTNSPKFGLSVAPTSSPNTSIPNSSSTRPFSTTSHASKHSIAPGAAAGIGVGSAIAGALIAALILWFTMRKARKRPIAPLGDPGYHPLLLDKLSGTGVEQSLPQPLGDQKIREEYSTVCTVINNHVRSYYHIAPLSTKILHINQAALEVLGRDATVSASTLTTLLSDPETRIPALRFCIAWTIVSRIELDCDPDISFLPPEIVRCLGSMSASMSDQERKSKSSAPHFH